MSRKYVFVWLFVCFLFVFCSLLWLQRELCNFLFFFFNASSDVTWVSISWGEDKPDGLEFKKKWAYHIYAASFIPLLEATLAATSIAYPIGGKLAQCRRLFVFCVKQKGVIAGSAVLILIFLFNCSSWVWHYTELAMPNLCNFIF